MANQLQLSITNATMISSGVNVNMENAEAVNRDGYILDYCRLNRITIQPWSPFQYGFFEGVFIGSDKFPELNAKLGEIAGRHGGPAAPSPTSRIELADLKERVRKLEGIAAGVDL